jgi:hypothetical protein
MNSACIIAACAANGRATTTKQSHNNYAHYFTKDFELYYVIKLRKYYHFEPMTLVTPEESPCYIGSIYAPVKLDVMLKPVFLDAKTIAIEHQFSIRADKCVGGVDDFVKNNLERLTTSGVWYDSDDQVLNKYISEINRKYNIDLDRSSLKYTNQFCWEIEPESR